jgi:hypothetical protein
MNVKTILNSQEWLPMKSLPKDQIVRVDLLLKIWSAQRDSFSYSRKKDCGKYDGKWGDVDHSKYVVVGWMPIPKMEPPQP